MVKEKQEQKREDIHKTNYKMANVNWNISIIILNVNGLNTPIRKHRLLEWRKKDPTTCYL